MHRGIAEYKAVNLGSASREELVIMLYEAAVRYQIYARTALSKGASDDARNHLRRVRDIFGELMVGTRGAALLQAAARASCSLG